MDKLSCGWSGTIYTEKIKKLFYFCYLHVIKHNSPKQFHKKNNFHLQQYKEYFPLYLV